MCLRSRRRISFRREEGRKKNKQAEVVESLIERVEKKLGEGEVKASLADYIRLVQLQKEIEEAEPREITVRWVEPETTGEEKADAKSDNER